MKTRYLIGIDEAGRGPLAGPVAVAVFLVREKTQQHLLSFFPKGEVRDSKKLAPTVRERIFKLLERAKVSGQVFYAVSFASATFIDLWGITAAVRLATARVLSSLDVKAAQCLVLLDGALHAPSRFTRQKTIIKGDEKEPVIALASIVAKVSRDRKMISLSKKYPQYDFHIHKGYGKKKHYKKIRAYGLSPIHRRSFLKGFDK